MGVPFEDWTSRVAETQTHVFRVSLRPKVQRDFEISSSETLHDLAATIVRFFDFEFDHAFGFYSKLTGRIFDSPVKYELFADMGEGEARSVKRTRIAEAFPTIGTKMTFLFDYGDINQIVATQSISTSNGPCQAETQRKLRAGGSAGKYRA
jgi:Plasmid pRiA4b ORF-3-like protein